MSNVEKQMSKEIQNPVTVQRTEVVFGDPTELVSVGESG